MAPRLTFAVAAFRGARITQRAPLPLMLRVRRHGLLAFTLIELLTAIAIIAILVSFSIGIVRGAKQRSAISRAKAELALLAQALEDYKRHYGDYPQAGRSTANSQRITGTSGPGLASTQGILFNALIGVYGPTDFRTRLNGPMLVDVAKFALELPLTNTDLATFAVASGSPPAKAAANNCFVDPWGNRYLYFYKRGATGAWKADSTYVLYSAGPDGAATTQPNALGIFTGASQATGDNADNLYADKLQ